MEAFWSNTIWYCLLALLSILAAIYAFAKTDNAKHWVGFGFAVLGSTFVFETGILTFLNAYKYIPKISSDPFLDSIIGNYFSQFLITVTVLLVLIKKLSRIWRFIIAAAIVGIEEWFLKLGIYEHEWYRTWMTFVLLLFLLWMANVWHIYLARFPNRLVYYLTLFLGASALFSVAIVFIQFTYKIHVFHPVVFPNDYYRNQAVMIVSYRTIIVLLMMILYRAGWRWRWKAIAFAGILGVQALLVEIGIQSFKSGFFFPVSLAEIIGSYACVALIAYWLRQGQASPNFL
ncbi:hypothetical protein [Cohnella thailandensis]|uniref:Histidine kinase N-terminal 7TM region domain-containing protein n=1 Tax=Cohnella thailandensis TaxID=557557 RepID=A0A841SZK6_9BACL|nr:hypothetical protein [Cohnella thailandensis]MBB6634221.1 hypothetical protein [Cohnella thailandensis]MBP1972281.1 hypothetical protein [Cohnella thailandensis]